MNTDSILSIVLPQPASWSKQATRIGEKLKIAKQVGANHKVEGMIH
jgi:hypothetical protein